MYQLEKVQLINESSLDQGFYFQSFFGEVCEKHLLEDSQIERIQIELVELMAKQVERYTNDESSSVRVEKAQELLQSVAYSIGVYLKSISDINEKIDVLKEEKISALFYRGMDALSKMKAKARLMLKNLQENNIKVNNYAYQDTIYTGIPEFFHNYNIEFEANDIPGSIDYPIFQSITNLLGVEYMYQYLYRFTLEDNYISKFSKQSVEMLLQSFSKDSEHMLVNIFELVLTNSLGCELLELKTTDLNIHPNDRAWLQKSLEPLSIEEIRIKLGVAFEHIAAELLLEADTVTYAKEAIFQIALRLEHNLQTNTLEKLFLSFIHEVPSEEEFYEDGIQMEDEKLRDLIEEISDCRFTSDKVAVIRQSIHSLSDLIELLEECFYGDEYVEVFQLLSDTEISILKKSIMDELGPDGLEDFEPQKEWQEKLLAM